MKLLKSEKFPFILSIIGLTADAITIFIFYDNISNPSENNEISNLSIILLLFIMMYGWFTISWVLITNSLKQLESAGNRSTITKTTLGIGFFLLPIPIVIDHLKGTTDFVIMHFLMWILIYLSIRLLIPVIKPELNKYMKQTLLLFEMNNDYRDIYGKWECTLDYKSHSSKEDFSVNDFIVIYEREFTSGNFTNSYHYNSSRNGKGKIHYSELDTYWSRIDSELPTESKS